MWRVLYLHFLSSAIAGGGEGEGGGLGGGLRE